MLTNQHVHNSPSSKVSTHIVRTFGLHRIHIHRHLNPKIDVMREYRKLDDTIVMRLNRSGALFRDSARSGKSQRFNDIDPNAKSDFNDDSEACLYIWRELIGMYTYATRLAVTLPLTISLLANWKSRTEIIDYCVSVVDSELTKKENKLNAILDSSHPSEESSPTRFVPSRPQGDSWRGPSSDFYKAQTQRPNPIPLATDLEERKRAEASMSYEDRQDFERRRREKENDAKSSLWEERVKVSTTLVKFFDCALICSQKTLISNEKTVEAIVRRRSYEGMCCNS